MSTGKSSAEKGKKESNNCQRGKNHRKEEQENQGLKEKRVGKKRRLDAVT